MTAQTPDLAAVVARLDKMERQNRRLKLAGLVLLVLAAAGLLMGQALPKRIIEAEKFLVKDRQGKVRAKLEVGEHDTPSLFLYDKEGKILIQ